MCKCGFTATRTMVGNTGEHAIFSCKLALTAFCLEVFPFPKKSDKRTAMKIISVMQVDTVHMLWYTVCVH